MTTNLPQQNTINQYVANGTSTVFTYSFMILSASTNQNDIEVFVTPHNQSANPAADLQILNTEYTVQGAGNVSGGTVTFISAPASGSIITLARNMNVSINTSFSNVQNFNGANLDAAFLRVLLIMQQLTTQYNQTALSYAIDSFLPPDTFTNLMPVLTNVNNQIWKSQAGQIIATVLEENPNVGTLRTDLASQTPGADGAKLIGYYDINSSLATTVDAFLNSISTSAIFQSGMMIDFGGYTVPTGWLLCDGSAVSRTTYASLLTALTAGQSGVITNGANTVSSLSSTALMYVGMALAGTGIPTGTSVASVVNGTSITMSANATASGTESITFYPWGAGDGSTTFNVPDMQRQVSMGSGGSAVSDTQGVGNLLSQFGGEEVHTLLTAEMPSHNHTITSSGSFAVSYAQAGSGLNNLLRNATPTTNIPVTVTSSAANTGGGGAHNNIQPTTVVTKIIKI